MRVNIFEAGLVTFLLAGTGHLPREDNTPKAGPDTQSWPASALPLTPRIPTPKPDPH